MLMSMLHILIMGSVFLYMFNKAQFTQTRLVALVPLGMLVVDACVFGAGVASPALSLLCYALRLTVLLCCFGAMKRDARLARTRERRRAYRKLQLQNAVRQAPAPLSFPQKKYA